MSDYIIKMDVENLKPHPINKSIYDFDQKQHDELVKSIELNGLLEPITIDNKHYVMSGHRRLGAIKELGWIDVECRLSHFPNPILSIVEMNRYRKKTSKEILRESEILKEEYSKKYLVIKNSKEFNLFHKDITTKNEARQLAGSK